MPEKKVGTQEKRQFCSKIASFTANSRALMK